MSEEEGSERKSDELFWKKLAIRYWYAIIVFGAILVGAFIGFVLTVDWYVLGSDVGGYGTWTFGDFSMGTGILWMLFFFLWMLLIVVLPTLAAVGVTIAILWVKILPTDAKDTIKAMGKRPKVGRKTEGGGGFSFLVFIGVCLFIYIDGNWLTTFDTLPISYFVTAWMTVIIWMCIIIVIPVVILGLLWFYRKYGQEDQTPPLLI
ncbi:MAG: hypothetical protein ACTSU3_02915 [Candidatus Thorarchaeota archaeon]